VSSVRQVSGDLADLFCELHDAISPPDFRAELLRWEAGVEGRVRAAEVERRALAGEPVAPQSDPEARWATLRGLDAALAHANPATGGVPPPALSEYALRYAEHGRLDSGAHGGALLPRFVQPGRRGQLPDDLRDAFGAVVRVPAPEWEACEHVVLPAWARLTRADRETGLRVATTPLVAEPDELAWHVVERGGLRFYRIHPADTDATRARIARIVDGFDDHDATIGVAPELCLSPLLLDAWRAALRGRARAGSSALRFVVVGTGNVEGSDPPTNTAVLLDAQTGEPLATQRKIYPFNFSPEDLELWGLADRLPAPIDEDLAPGERVAVIEAGGARLAILVCEDLARLHAFAPALSAHGVSLILVPVFARPTKDRRWERARAETYSDSTGSTVLVANSLVMATVLGTPRPAGTCLAVAPGAATVGHAVAADDVVVFALAGGQPELAHEPAG
jgi:predicted amidohydrolase